MGATKSSIHSCERAAVEALMATYGGSSSSDADSSPSKPSGSSHSSNQQEFDPLPPPPLALLNPPNSLDYSHVGQGSRVRRFPHVEGNYALHVFIPVHIPSSSRKELAQFIKRLVSLMPSLHVVDIDTPLNLLCKDDQKLEDVVLGRELHISLARTVPIRVHQIDSIVTMLRQKFQSQRRYWMNFSKWEVFVNDDGTRTFLSMEVISGGLAEITKQINAVNQIYRLHNLPEFYKDPRPHVSLAWAVGDVSHLLKQRIQAVNCTTGTFSHKHIFSCKFNGIECKIGKKVYKICKFSG